MRPKRATSQTDEDRLTGGRVPEPQDLGNGGVTRLAVDPAGLMHLEHASRRQPIGSQLNTHPRHQATPSVAAADRSRPLFSRAVPLGNRFTFSYSAPFREALAYRMTSSCVRGLLGWWLRHSDVRTLLNEEPSSAT